MRSEQWVESPNVARKKPLPGSTFRKQEHTQIEPIPVGDAARMLAF